MMIQDAALRDCLQKIITNTTSPQGGDEVMMIRKFLIGALRSACFC